MNIIHIDQKAYDLLIKWKDENKLLIKSVSPYNNYYFDKVEVDYGMYPDEEIGKPLVAYFEKKNDFVKFRIKYDKRQITKGEMKATPGGGQRLWYLL